LYAGAFFIAIGAGFQCVDATAASSPPLVSSTRFDPTQFGTGSSNPWFPLVPGTRHELIERDGSKTSVNVVTVTSETKTILGVTCVVVHDTITRDGVLKEDTYDWFATDRQGNVWYFGEETRQFRASGKATLAGSWEAGVNGARPGLVMPAIPTAGETHVQEVLADGSGGLARVEALDDAVKVPYGAFSGVLRIREWTNRESGFETKWYAKGIGLVREEASDGEIVELIAVARDR
jgi:hypothetical protein